MALLGVTTASVTDFFTSGTWLVIRNLFVFIAIVFWGALGYWTYKDARRRIEDPWLVAMATVVGLVPPYLGPFVYMLFRPPEYLDDVRERELEMKAIQERLVEADLRCPVCRADVDAGYLVCPVCTTRLKQACESCKAPLEPAWQVCPYCETPIGPLELSVLPAPGTSRGRRRAHDYSGPPWPSSGHSS